MADEPEGEIAVTGPGGIGARAKGYRLLDLIWLPMVLGIGYLIILEQTHAGDTKDAANKTAQVLKESNEKIAQTLKENTRDLTDALKQISIENKRSNEIQREQTCLLTLPPDRRTNAADFCKRLSRER